MVGGEEGTSQQRNEQNEGRSHGEIREWEKRNFSKRQESMQRS